MQAFYLTAFCEQEETFLCVFTGSCKQLEALLRLLFFILSVTVFRHMYGVSVSSEHARVGRVLR